jgi:hypothetical protein
VRQRAEAGEVAVDDPAKERGRRAVLGRQRAQALDPGEVEVDALLETRAQRLEARVPQGAREPHHRGEAHTRRGRQLATAQECRLDVVLADERGQPGPLRGEPPLDSGEAREAVLLSTLNHLFSPSRIRESGAMSRGA